MTRAGSSRAAARSCCRDGAVAVEATGKYLKQTLADITDDGFAEREWFTDPRGAPEHVDL